MREVRSLRRLRWRLTLAYAASAVATMLLLQLLLLGGIGFYLLRSDGFAVDLATRLGALGEGIAGELEAMPSSRDALERRVVTALDASSPADGSIHAGIQVATMTPTRVVVYARSQEPVLSLSCAAGACTTVEPPELEAEERTLLARAIEGERDPRNLATRLADGGAAVAAPVASPETSPRGAIFARTAAPFTTTAYLAAAARLLATNGLAVALLSGLAGLVFGAWAARWLVRRLTPIADAASAWARGDFGAQASISGADELAALGAQLDAMATQLRTLVDLRETVATLEERDRVARDLHDTVKQHLFATAMQLGAARSLLARDVDRAAACLADATDLVTRSQRDLMAIMGQPAASREDSPANALDIDLEAWSKRTGIPLDVELAVTPGAQTSAEAIARIVHEALSNVARHSRARKASVRLRADGSGKRFTLTVEDDGCGLGEPREGGLGLRSMRLRAEALPGGTFAVETRPEGGTRVCITFDDRGQ